MRFKVGDTIQYIDPTGNQGWVKNQYKFKIIKFEGTEILVTPIQNTQNPEWRIGQELFIRRSAFKNTTQRKDPHPEWW
jgi:hypothetical protein